MLRGNTFAHIRKVEPSPNGFGHVMAVYFDDQLSAHTTSDNTFIECDIAVFIGGGRRHVVRDNYFHNNLYAVHVDDRGLNWERAFADPNGPLVHELQRLRYQQPPWSRHYPELVGIVHDRLGTPAYNRVFGNRWCCLHNHSQCKGFLDVPERNLTEWASEAHNNTMHCSQGLQDAAFGGRGQGGLGTGIKSN